MTDKLRLNFPAGTPGFVEITEAAASGAGHIFTEDLERKTQRFVAKMSRTLNELVIQALSRATGTIDPNPYAYLNRMSKNDNRDGTTIYLDGSPILWVGRPSIPFDARVTWGADYVTTIDTPYRFMGEEKPALSSDSAGPVQPGGDQPS